MIDIELLLTGAIFGLSAGLSPGPLMTLIVSETLQNGRKAGFTVALAPIFTDIPIILMAIFFLTKMSEINLLLGTISMAGGVFIAYIGYQNITSSTPNLKIKNNGSGSLKKAIMTNILNPHPYIFFFSIGGPLLIKSMERSIESVGLFFLFFIGSLIATNIGIAQIASKSTQFLQNKVYKFMMRLLGIVMVVFSINFFLEGLKFIGFIK